MLSLGQWGGGVQDAGEVWGTEGGPSLQGAEAHF